MHIATVRFSALLVVCLLTAGCLRGIVPEQIWGAPRAVGGSLSESQAPTFDSERLLEISEQLGAFLDATYFGSTGSDPYSDRLHTLTRRHANEDSFDVASGVHLRPEIYSFVLPHGALRLYAGLMDYLDDNELRYVIAHEIGHLVRGHSARRLEAALEGVVEPDDASRKLSEGELVNILEGFSALHYSAEQEQEADRYALQFLRKYRYHPDAAVSALQKLSELLPPQPYERSHPDLAGRHAALEAATGKNRRSRTKAQSGAKRLSRETKSGTLRRSADDQANAASRPQTAPAIAPQRGGARADTTSIPPAQDELPLGEALRPGWYLQLAVAEEEVDALAVRNELESLNFPTAVLQSRSGIYKVLVGPAARKERLPYEQLRSFGFIKETPLFLHIR